AGTSEQDFTSLRRKRLAGSDLVQRNEVNESEAGQHVNDSDDRHAIRECARQRASGIVHFACQLSEIPPTGKGKESSHHAAGQGADQRRGIGRARDERREVGPVTELKSNAPEKHKRQQAKLEKRDRPYESGAEFHAANIN